MVQAWFTLLDLGLTPAMSRQAAHYSGGGIDGQTLRQLFRVLNFLFWSLSSVLCIVVLLGADYISKNWLNVEKLPIHQVKHSIMLMGFIIGFRWVSGLYRGIISGFEKFVWLNTVSIVVSTFRFVCVIPLFIYVGSTPSVFFTFQLIVAISEAIVLGYKSNSLTPSRTPNDSSIWQWASFKDTLKFSLTIALTGGSWILVTQTDKLILSRVLSLTDYGYFTLAVSVANGINLINGPISKALMPRFTHLDAEKRDEDFVHLYRQSTQVVASIVVSASVVFYYFSDLFFLAWTGDDQLVRNVVPIAKLYALGNGCLSLSGFTYYLQYAKGDLKLHLVGTILFLIILLPSLVWSTLKWGAIGPAYAWLISQALSLILWVPVVHRRFFVGLHSKWFFFDIVPIIIVTTLTCYLIRLIVGNTEDRIYALIYVVVASIFSLLVAGLTANGIRTQLISFLKRRILT